MRKILLSLSLVALLATPNVFAAEPSGIVTESLDIAAESADVIADGSGLSEYKKIDAANTCYFDSQYKKMKKDLGLSCDQEIRIDSLYNQYRSRIISLRDQKHCEQKKLCRMIEDGACNSEIREQQKEVKELHKKIKEECKGFRRDVNVQLVCDQKGEYRKFNRDEYFKMKKLAKNCRIYTFPCVDSNPCPNPCPSGCPIRK